MKTKTCYRCKRKLLVSEFSKQARAKDGLQSYCILCAREVDRINCKKRTEAKQERDEKKYNVDVLGGYKCYVPNHVKEGEFKFNVVFTDGRVFNTNQKEKFVEFIRGL